MHNRLFVAAVVTGLLTATAANASTTTVTQGQEGWGGPTFDFTKTRTVGGTDYFGWDPLTIDSSWSSGTFTFDITMPRTLTGGDNFDLVIDWDNDGFDSDGDFLVHYSNSGATSPGGGGWDGTWDAKSRSGGNWDHIGSNGLSDLSQTTVNASTSDQRNFEVSFDGTSDISYQWLSPLGDDGFPQEENFVGEAVVIGFWDGGDPADNIAVRATSVPLPASFALFGVGLFGLAALRRRAG